MQLKDNMHRESLSFTYFAFNHLEAPEETPQLMGCTCPQSLIHPCKQPIWKWGIFSVLENIVVFEILWYFFYHTMFGRLFKNLVFKTPVLVML